MLEHRPPERRLLFLKAWNEWAEGNHLEPDLRFGTGFLQVVADALGEAGQSEPPTPDWRWKRRSLLKGKW